MTAEELSFKEKILLIEEEVVDLTAPSSLLNVSRFIEIFENGKLYLDEAFLLIQDNDLTIQQKLIVLLCLQKTDIQYYKYFLKNITMLFKNEEIDEVLIYYAFGYTEWTYCAIENYRDKIVREAIDVCLAKPGISPSLENFLKDIKSGRAWQRIKRRQRSREVSTK